MQALKNTELMEAGYSFKSHVVKRHVLCKKEVTRSRDQGPPHGGHVEGAPPLLAARARARSGHLFWLPADMSSHFL